MNLSRIIFVDPDQAAVKALNRSIQVEHGSVEVRDHRFFGVPITYAYVITSKLPASAAEPNR
jgi:hypothetical protein